MWGHVVLTLADDRAVRFWEAALGWPLSSAGFERRSFQPPTGDPYVHGRTGPPGVGLALEAVDPAADAARLIDLGATWLDRGPDRPTLRSPGGLDVDLVAAHDHVRPEPTGEPGRRRRLVQLCVDSPATRHDREVEFWKAATGWRFVESDTAGFAGTLYPPTGASIELLLQRLDPDSPADRVRVHVDLGCDDREAEAQRLVTLGAERLHDGHGWVTLRDPAGLIFCATGRSPDSP